MLDKTIGFALCGSFCTYAKAMAALKNLTNIYAKVIPIFSQASWETDSRFGTADGHIRQAEDLCGVPALHTIPQVEPQEASGRPGRGPLHWQYLSEAGSWHCRRPRDYGG